MKTNMEYLHEFIKDNSEALEFWEAVADEIEETKSELKSYEDDIKDLKDKIVTLEDDLESKVDEEDLESIDFGIGK